MSITGRIVNGLVVLPPGIKMPEGAAVRIETMEAVSQDDSPGALVERLAKPRPHLPEDYALNHGQAVPSVDPIPIRPAGFFANCYGKEEIQEQNRLAKASVIRPPADLE
ncbi:MAG: hypothetical protein ABSC18_15080 [Verrucomicrobiota bacterium]|jgi:hypothetical protein